MLSNASEMGDNVLKVCPSIGTVVSAKNQIDLC